MRLVTIPPLLLLLAAPPSAAQGLRDQFQQLFILGGGEDPLFLGGTADPDNPASIRAHSDHFVPAAVGGNAALIGFLTNAIGSSVAGLPLSATAGGATFSFVGGVPVRTAVSTGPIFAERARTLGRGRVFVGATINRFTLKSLRGVQLDDVQLNFTHVNADFPGCDTVFGGDCSLMGIPQLENDVIQFRLNLDVDVRVTSFALTYGLLDRVDLGFVVPLVTTDLRGTSEAQVQPFGGPTAAHFFAGTPSDPELTASRTVEGSATGLGDVGVRLKINVARGDARAVAVLADARFPTGSERDLLGAGHVELRGLGLFSARFGDFTPHANVGYLYRDSDIQNDAVLVTAGFDQLLAPWATLALDLVSQFQVGDAKLDLPGTVRYDVPFRRTVEPTNIPEIRDDVIDASIGMKFTTASGITLVANSLWPLNRGGLRPDVVWTVGVEYSF